MQRNTKTIWLGAGLALALSVPALAQEGGAEPPPLAGPRPPELDLGTGPSGLPQTEPGASGGPALPADERSAPPLTEEERLARSAQINRNYDDTLDVYQGILDREDTDTKLLERRIEANQQLLERYGPELRDTQHQLRSANVAFLNRVMSLKRQYDAKEITDEQFKARLEEEERRYQKRKARLAEDVSYYTQEQAQTKARLDTLQRSYEVRAREREMRQGPDAAKPAAPGEALFASMNGMLDQLSGFRVRFTMSGVDDLYRYAPLHANGAPPAESTGEDDGE